MSRLGRYGLLDVDGNCLSGHTIRAAHAGSAVDADMCHLAVRIMLQNTCRNLYRATREFDLEGGSWCTDTYDESGRYADDVMADWRLNGAPTDISLHDAVCAYARTIKHCTDAIPARSFGQDDFACTAEYGMAPRSIYPPRRPPAYRIGEGHATAPDAVGHPLIDHTIRDGCSPPGLAPHSWRGCAIRPAKGAPARGAPSPYGMAQPEKEDAILDMVGLLDPEAAYVLEGNGRHDILLCGGVDGAEAFRRADEIQGTHGTPVGCLVMGSADLLNDPYGNDAKRIVADGTALAGKLRAAGRTMPPRPAALPRDSVMRNLDRNGFEIGVHSAPGPAAYVRPEYVVAAAHFTNEARWYLSAVPVLLCHRRLDWGLMLFLARTYGFAGTLHGILREMASVRRMGFALDFMERWGVEPIGTEQDTIREVLRIYNPPA